MNAASLTATISPYLKNKRRVAAVLVAMAAVMIWLVWPEDPRRHNEIRETRALTLEDVGFTLPAATKGDKLGVKFIQSGMTYGDIKGVLERDGWVFTEKREPTMVRTRVGGRLYAVTVPIMQQTLTAKKLTINRHRENNERFALFNILNGNYPESDTDRENLTITMVEENYIVDIHYRAEWSDQYKVGPEFDSQVDKILAYFGHNSTDKYDPNEAKSAYCFDTTGQQKMVTDCKGVRVETKLVKCTDPDPRTSLPFSGETPDPFYKTRACELSITYHDNETEEAFDKLRNLMYVKFKEIFGEPDR
ncbi:hypothetical protein [Rhizobium leguminosarum]|uniref:hypothetical protein n=1 Tax=Rhizobium leguminosarum TaxID=384 RepID=UPI0013BCDAD1|nr:hypothetical protein [Rhizobium leguminosarum]NEI65006.1 hypothetical protein [Rhizobium leguminosarum]